MQGRQKLASLVLWEGMSIAAAARECGVSRATAHLWVKRAREEGISELQERSRRPEQVRSPTSQVIVEQVLAAKCEKPRWGAKKLHQKLWPSPDSAPICVRTVDRLLQRQGLTVARNTVPAAVGRFERSQCNELWQMDYKGLEGRWGYSPLSVLDDHARFCLALEPVERRIIEAVWSVLWRVFDEFGLPECILCDNGDGFNSVKSQGPTVFQARLWRLGVKTAHGRPYHPQTQGKVERFHRTLEDEWSQELRQPSIEHAHRHLPQIRASYNWERPHEALGQRVPGAVYESSRRPRPARLPEPLMPEGAIKRRVDCCGKFGYRNRTYRAGRGLSGEWVEIRELEEPTLFYTGIQIASLTTLEV